jgi:hypothetical protein
VLDTESSDVPRITHQELRELLTSKKDNLILIDLRESPFQGEPRIEGSKILPGISKSQIRLTEISCNHFRKNRSIWRTFDIFSRVIY